MMGTRGGIEPTKALLTKSIPPWLELLINNFFQKYTEFRNTEVKRRRKK
jgi:hypothetical protein